LRNPIFGISPLGPSRKVKASIRKAVGSINGPISDAAERLEKLLCSRHGIRRENMLFAGSVSELVFLVLQAFAPKQVIVAAPAGFLYGDAASASGASADYMHRSPLPDFLKKAADFDAAFLSNPDNITGRYADIDITGYIRDSRCLFVIDESLIEFACVSGSLRLASVSENLIVLRTTANYFGLPGLELAYAFASGRIISELGRRRISSPNLLALVAAAAAMRDKAYIRASSGFISAERGMIAGAAARIPGAIVHESDSNILLVKLPMPAGDICAAAERGGLSVMNCTDIRGLDDTHICISVMKHEKNLKLARLFRRIAYEAERKDRL